MQLSTIAKPANLSQRPTGVNLDLATNIAPKIVNHITSLESLLSMLPGSVDICNKLAELKNMLDTKLPSSSPVIEDQEPAPTILDYDPSKPLGQQRAHTHGVSADRMGYLPAKVIREAGFVGNVIEEIDEMEVASANHQDLLNKYTELSKWTEQMLRTATTLKNGAKEMFVKKKLGGIFPKGTNITEQHVEHHAQASVGKLENVLTTMVKSGSSLSYKAINDAMTTICKEDGCSPDDLHKLFRASHGDMTPDAWAKSLKDGSFSEGIDQMIKDEAVMEMYETMRVGLGDRAWVAITKRLRSQGHDANLVESMINRAIIMTKRS